MSLDTSWRTYLDWCADAVETACGQTEQYLNEEAERFPLSDWIDTQPEERRRSLHQIDALRMKVTALQAGFVFDALSTSAALFRSTDYRSVWAHGALSRVALEAATTACELLSREVAPEERLLRTVTLGIAGRRQEQQLYDAGTANGARVLKQIQWIQRLARESGFEPVPSARGDREVGWLSGPYRSSYRWNMTDLVDNWMTAMPRAYRVTSPSVHAGWWFLGGTFDAAPSPELRGTNYSGPWLTTMMELEACRALLVASLGEQDDRYRAFCQEIHARSIVVESARQALRHLAMQRRDPKGAP